MKFEYDLNEMEAAIGGSCLDDLRALVEEDTGKPTSFDDGDVVFAFERGTVYARIVAEKTLYKLDLGASDFDELDDVDWESVQWTRAQV